ncbi:MAG TPA: DUF4926 domain-containing protein [Tepidisphaeraceae bacterium]|jgi:hypothetical protein|nr:DUF4926 domain-containing protein [Tepidisphaeraceae bacterium]
MSATQLNELDVVAVTVDLPDLSLARGQVGAVVHVHAPGVYEVEFVDHAGRTYAVATLPGEQLLPLRYEPAAA